eukprot:TRINITY_DN657_c0_g1_i2.p1 TRINITY_DN657_c0_g1~~TRINITY_DN657_c0_g1_i2.p1  ORF type:complete len:156 (-),score=23.90 TRINITY_DN657_c0_g1_i2:486-953(-)
MAEHKQRTRDEENGNDAENENLIEGRPRKEPKPAQFTKTLKWYAAFNSLRWLVLMGICVGYSIALHAEMKDYYTRTRCFNCLNVARNDPDRRWEFGLCDVPINVTNALTANSVRFGIRVMGNTSQATSMVLMSCILLGAGALLIAISLKMAFFPH